MTQEQDTLSIRSKPMQSVRTLLFWLVLACLLPGVIVAAVLLVHQYQNSRTQLQKDMLQTARTLSLVVDKEIVRIQGKLEILALSPTIQSGDLPAFYRHAQDIMATETLAGAIVLIDATGQQVINTLRPLGKELPKTGHPELLQRTFGTSRPSVSDLYIGGVAKSFFVAMEVPVRQGGKVVYGLDMGIPAEHLSQILMAQKLPQDWVTALLDSHGVVIARSQNAARFVGQKGEADLIEQMGKSKEGSLASHILEGEPAIVAFSRSASSGWTMAIGVPSQSLEAALLRTVALFGLGTAILFGLGVGVAWYLGGRIARSARALDYHQDSIREDERRRIALDIHDSLGQNLMVLRIDVSLLSEHADSVGVTKTEIDAIVKQIDTTIKSVRAIINDLRPAVLSLGLHAAVEWQAKEFERHTGIACKLHIDHDEFAMDERVSTALFRIVQESLTNIMRHAQANHVQIDMLKKDGQLVIQIADDGIGLSADYVRKANAFGLVGIEERITVLGGTLAIDSTPGQGTTLILSVPIDMITTQKMAATPGPG